MESKVQKSVVCVCSQNIITIICNVCLLYTSDASDERLGVDLGGRRIIKKNFFQAEDGIRDHRESRGLGDVYKRQDE